MTEGKETTPVPGSFAVASPYHNVFIQTYSEGQCTFPLIESQGLIVGPEKCLDFFSHSA